MLRAKSRLVESFTHILSSDPALDVDAEDFAARWQTYLDGLGDPPLKTGEKPTVWTLKVLGTRQQLRLSKYSSKAIADKHELPQMIAAGFAVGLISVEGLTDEEGKPVKVTHDLDDGVQVVSENLYNLFEPSWVFELGARVIARMNAGPK